MVMVRALIPGKIQLATCATRDIWAHELLLHLREDLQSLPSRAAFSALRFGVPESSIHGFLWEWRVLGVRVAQGSG